MTADRGDDLVPENLTLDLGAGITDADRHLAPNARCKRTFAVELFGRATLGRGIVWSHF